MITKVACNLTPRPRQHFTKCPPLFYNMVFRAGNDSPLFCFQLINWISFQMAVLAFIYNCLAMKCIAKQVSAVSIGTPFENVF